MAEIFERMRGGEQRIGAQQPVPSYAATDIAERFFIPDLKTGFLSQQSHVLALCLVQAWGPWSIILKRKGLSAFLNLDGFHQQRP